jgi:hypothetical protein
MFAKVRNPSDLNSCETVYVIEVEERGKLSTKIILFRESASPGTIPSKLIIIRGGVYLSHQEKHDGLIWCPWKRFLINSNKIQRVITYPEGHPDTNCQVYGFLELLLVSDIVPT